MKDALKIKSSALPDSARVAGFKGTEGISRLYRFDVYLYTVDGDGADIDLADVVGAKATLEIERDDGGPPFVINGIFATFALIQNVADQSLFHATLVPQLWQLTQTFHSRIFTQQSIPDILKATLDDGGLASSDYDIKLSQTYKPEEHVCQYQESHFDFISRWMEREGMYYYFEQGDSSEKLIITDSKSSQSALDTKPVAFLSQTASAGNLGAGLHAFTCKHHALPASVKYKDYDYTKPTLDVSGTAPVSKVGIGEISVYGARFFSPDDGKRIAKLRAEEILARQVVYHGSGGALCMRAGYFFTLEDHPRSAFDIEYQVIEAEHTGNQSIDSPEMRALTGIDNQRTYWVEVSAIPSSVQFRAESKTAWPRIYGFENGTVCGPAETEYAQIDDNGRYNVKFKFDESDLKNGKASTWVRMLQPHGGSPEGFHFPLRKGTEVLFTFLGGDPDRPVIAGVVNNTHTPSPVTKGNHTLNVIQTGGRNRFELEDKAGQQRVTLSTPHANSYVRMGSPNDGHEFIIHTDEHCLLQTGSDWDVKIGGHLDERVTGTTYEEYGNTRSTKVTGNADETWSANLSIYVNGTTSECWHGAHQMNSQDTRLDEVNGACTEIFHSSVDRTLFATLGEKISGNTTRTIGGTLSDTVSGTHTLATGARTDTITGTLTQTASGPITITAPAITQTATGPQSFITNGSKMGMTIGASLSMDLSVSLSLFAGVKFSAEASICIGATAGLKAQFGSALDMRTSPLQVTLGAAMTTIAAGTSVDIVTPTLMIPAGAVVIV
jgi:type VI secretion system secreted protein VgrG